MKDADKVISELANHLKILGYDSKTYLSICQGVEEFAVFLKETYSKSDFKQVSKEEVSCYIDYLKTRDNLRKTGSKLSSVHINGHIYSLNKLSEYLWEVSKVTLPMTHIRRLKSRTKEKAILSIEEIKELFNQTHSTSKQGMRDRAMLSIYYGCGLRRMEGEALKLKDIDFKNELIHIRNGKGRKERLVPMSDIVRDYLREYIDVGRRRYLKGKRGGQYLFISEKGNALQSQSLSNRLKDLVEKARIEKKVGLHTLRHSIATHLLQNGMELADISQFLGHSSMESTQIYTHIDESTVY